MNLIIAPKDKQPAGGFKHPGHLLAYGPVHRAWNATVGWYETNEYCVAPSHSMFDRNKLKGSIDGAR